MKSKKNFMRVCGVSVCTVFCVLWTDSVCAAGFSSDVIAQGHERLAPAICLLAYSVEITNPNTGETHKRDRSAMGLIVAPDGLVMAFGHMALEDSDPFNIRVTVGEGEDEKKYDAILLKKPDDINVCFLRIENEEKLDLPVVSFDKGVVLGLGEEIMVMGVLGESLDYRRAIQFRHVGALLEKPRRTYCLDQPTALGFAGGPVMNKEGQVVGVIGYDLSPDEGGDLYIRTGSALVYQTDLFLKYIENPPSVEELAEDAEDAWLGILTQPLDDDMAEYWGLEKEGGVIVASILPGSPADRSGLLRGDVIVSFNEVPVRSKQNREVLGFTKLVRDTGPGKVVPIKVLRDGVAVELQAELIVKPKSASEADEFKDEVFGLTLREITTDVRIMLNLAEDVQGVIVRKVKSGSVAQQAEMRPGVIILSFAEHPVTDLESFKEIVARVEKERPKEVPVFCRVGSKTGFFRLQPRWDADE